jgi:SAM-dependent methyltransferase
MAVKANSYQLAKVGPVHFQPLQWELEQVGKYFNGKVMNAGCGNRNIDEILKSFGAAEVVNYDIESTIPGAVIGSLVDIPIPDDTFDSIICNAVLEHVPAIDSVMSELARVLKPGGHFIAGVPYLQPYHLNPTDFRRYTKDGLRELGEIHGLETVDILPVHTITQTLGWIAWEYAKERGGVRPYIVFPIVWLATRLFHKTDKALINNANTLQAVYTKSAKSKPAKG